MKKALQNLLPIIFLLVFSAIIGFNSGSIFGYNFNKEIPDQFTLDEIKSIFPNAASYKVTKEDEATVFDSNNQKLGEAFHTLPKSKEIKVAV